MKKLIKITAISLFALMLALVAVGCGEEVTTTPVTDPPCEHVYADEVTREMRPLSDGVITYTCEKCGDSYEEAIPASKSVKILAIGNSFSVDAMDHLWKICEDGGAEEIILGNMYIGGCSLSTHWSNMATDAKAYTYYENTVDEWRQTANTALSTALSKYDWDIITIQQASGDSGVAATYVSLEKIIGYLEENKPKEETELWWHMTWAYQGNSTHNSFPKYQRDQMTMYNAIVSATNEKVLPTEAFDGVIPSGTAIQNLRTSYIGDTLTRDGYHMSYDIGRYTLALTWYATLLGGDVDAIDWVPGSYEAIKHDLAPIREAVKGALENQFEVTESKLTERSYDDLFEAMGLDLSKYTKIDWEPKVKNYYNSTHHANLYPSESNSRYFIASKIFDKTTLPVGSVIVVDKGYQYRPEGWTALTSTNTSSTRPTNVTTQVVEVTDAWWGSFNYRAFNLSYVGAKTDVTDADAAHLQIYVPNK